MPMVILIYNFPLRLGSLRHVLVLGVLVVEDVEHHLYTYCLHMLGKFANAFGPLRFGSYAFLVTILLYNFGHEFYGLMSCMDCIHNSPFFYFSGCWS